MRYYINELEIRSENAAKPPNRASAWIVDWIAQYPSPQVALDYGCGKLRYADHLAHRFERVHIVDSEIQLTRTQVILGRKTTIKRDATESYSNITIHYAESDTWTAVKADLVFCANVLSAVPFERTRIEILQRLASILKPAGRLFLSVQSRNSHFTAWQRSPSATVHEDGYLLQRGSNASFYACIPLRRLEDYVRAAGLEVEQGFRHDQTGAVIARLKQPELAHD